MNDSAFDVLYTKALKKLNVPITLLEIKDDELHLMADKDDESKEWILPIGVNTISNFFMHNPPTWAEIENAINYTEDIIVPLSTKLESGSLLVSFTHDLFRIVESYDKDAKSPYRMSIEQVESVFSRWGFLVSGRPFTTDTLPEDLRFAAFLLLLREVMHHLGFNSIIIN
jgi:hypothetical protein